MCIEHGFRRARGLGNVVRAVHSGHAIGVEGSIRLDNRDVDEDIPPSRRSSDLDPETHGEIYRGIHRGVHRGIHVDYGFRRSLEKDGLGREGLVGPAQAGRTQKVSGASYRPGLGGRAEARGSGDSDAWATGDDDRGAR